jgi:multisubunit Na+/H+ antiporter MnhC subunit
MMTASVLGIYNYWIYVLLMMIGLYGVIAKPNLIKQAIALGLFQTGIFLYYISMAVIDGGTAPVWTTDPADGARSSRARTTTRCRTSSSSPRSSSASACWPSRSP